MFSVSTLEARTLIRTIHKTYGTDLSGLAMASFRLRLSEILESYSIEKTQDLLARLRADQDLFELFIRDISIGSTDMFRDPDLWIFIRDNLLPSILKLTLYPEIVIPESITGGELYTLAVLLQEAGIDYRVDLVVSCRNEKIREQILKGELPQARFKNSMDNYEVFHPGSSLEQHTKTRNGIRYLKPDLTGKVNFRIQSPGQRICSDKTTLILYRNKMIYQNAELQYKTLKNLLNEMPAGTHIIFGIKEAIYGFGLDNMYSELSADLNIYTKKDVH